MEYWMYFLIYISKNVVIINGRVKHAPASLDTEFDHAMAVLWSSGIIVLIYDEDKCEHEH